MNQSIIKDAPDISLGFSEFIARDCDKFIIHLKEFDTKIYPQLVARECGLKEEDAAFSNYLHDKRSFLINFIDKRTWLIEAYIYNHPKKFFHPNINMKDAAEWFVSFFGILSLANMEEIADNSEFKTNLLTKKILLMAYHSLVKTNKNKYSKAQWITILTAELENAFNLYRFIKCFNLFGVITDKNLFNYLDCPLPSKTFSYDIGT